MDLKALFASTKTIAIVGMSTRTDRPSNEVATIMQREGFRILPVNPAYAGQTILGESFVPTLADVPVPIDIVDCFRKSEDMVEVALAAAAIVFVAANRAFKSIDFNPYRTRRNDEIVSFMPGGISLY